MEARTQFAELLAISYKDFATESEYFVVGTGSGLEVNDLHIDLDDNCNDPSCNPDCRDEIYGSQCPWKKIDQTVFRDCPNVIAVGPGDFIPPNSILVVMIDQNENLVRSAEALCSLDGCIYVLYNECERCLDAFADEDSGSYTIYGNGYSSNLNYVAQPDGGSVNSSGDYVYDRDNLPRVTQNTIDITATVTEQFIDLSCTDYDGRVYVKGLIVSERYNSDCCSPYTPTLTFDLDCDDGPVNPPPPPPPPPGGDEELFDDFPFLTNLVEQDDCDGTIISVYDSGAFAFLHIQTATEGKLYFQDGTLYCTDAMNFSCVTAYGLGAPEEVWECGKGGPTSPPVPGPGTAPEFFEDFSFLNDLVDLADCFGTTVSLYTEGIYTFIHVETEEGGTLYFQDGTRYCTDAPGFSCVTVYGLSTATEVWNCDGTGGGPVTTPELFVEHSWLDLIVDLSDCDDAVISVYQSGIHLYFFVYQDGVTTMYNEAGLFYCQDGPGFSCLSAYGFTATDFVESWECEGLQGEVELDLRSKEREGLVVDLYPNPTTGDFYIISDGAVSEVILYSATGELVQRTLEEIGENQWSVAMQDMQSGVYYIRIIAGQNQVIQRLVKI